MSSEPTSAATATAATQASMQSTTGNKSTNTDCANTDTKPPYLASLTTLSQQLTSHPHELILTGAYEGVLQQPERAFQHTLIIETSSIPEVIHSCDLTQNITGRLLIQDYGEYEVTGECILRTGMLNLEISERKDNSQVELFSVYTGRVATRRRKAEAGILQSIEFQVVPHTTNVPKLVTKSDQFELKLNRGLLLPIVKTEGCPIVSCERTTLSLVCRYLSLKELLAISRTNRILQSAACHPLTFQFDIHVEVHKYRGIIALGPQGTFSDDETLRSALGSSLLSNFRLMTLRSPYRSKTDVNDEANANPSWLYHLMTTLIDERQTSLYGLFMISHASASYWKGDAIEYAKQDLVANVIPNQPRPPRAMQCTSHRHALMESSHPPKVRLSCCVCNCFIDAHSLYYGCIECSGNSTCHGCFKKNGGFTLPASAEHSKALTKSHDDMWKALSQSRAAAYLKILNVYMHRLAMEYITQYLPPQLEYFEYEFLDHRIDTTQPPLTAAALQPGNAGANKLHSNDKEPLLPSQSRGEVLAERFARNHQLKVLSFIDEDVRTYNTAPFTHNQFVAQAYGTTLQDLYTLEAIERKCVGHLEKILWHVMIQPRVLTQSIEEQQGPSKPVVAPVVPFSFSAASIEAQAAATAPLFEPSPPTIPLPKLSKIDTLMIGALHSNDSTAFLSMFHDVKSILLSQFISLDHVLYDRWPSNIAQSLQELIILRSSNQYAIAPGQMFGVSPFDAAAKVYTHQELFSYLAAAHLTNLKSFSVEIHNYNTIVTPLDLEEFFLSAPNLTEVQLKAVRMISPHLAFRHLKKLQTLKEFTWSFLNENESFVEVFPALTSLHVADAEERTPVKWSTTLKTLPSLLWVKWRREKRLAPSAIDEYFATLAAARTRVANERAAADAETARELAIRLEQKAITVAAIAPREQASEDWYRGSTKVAAESPEQISIRLRMAQMMSPDATSTATVVSNTNPSFSSFSSVSGTFPSSFLPPLPATARWNFSGADSSYSNLFDGSDDTSRQYRVLSSSAAAPTSFNDASSPLYINQLSNSVSRHRSAKKTPTRKSGGSHQQPSSFTQAVPKLTQDVPVPSLFAAPTAPAAPMFSFNPDAAPAAASSSTDTSATTTTTADELSKMFQSFVHSFQPKQ